LTDRPPDDEDESTSTTTRVLIVDDHAVVRQGLRTFLDLDPSLDVIGEAADGAEAVRAARRLRPDVILMDLLMPEMDGITAIQLIRQELPDIEVIALTSVLEDASVIGAVRAGAIGYLLKDTQADELVRAIKAAAAGQVQLSPRAAARLLRDVRTPEPATLTHALSPPRNRGVAPARGWQDQQSDGPRAIDRRKNDQDPRESDPGQTGRAKSDSGSVVRRTDRSASARRIGR
jgi:DNA-binding NarL/FixJ family response regulator